MKRRRKRKSGEGRRAGAKGKGRRGVLIRKEEGKEMEKEIWKQMKGKESDEEE